MRERDPRLAGLSVAGDLMSLVSTFVAERGLSVPVVESRAQSAKRLTFDEWWHVLEQVHLSSSDDAIGVELARRVGPEHVGVIGYLTLSCKTVLEAFQHFERFQKLLYEGPRARLELKDGLAGLIWDTGYGASTRLSDQVILAGFVTFLRRMTGQQVEVEWGEAERVEAERVEVWWHDVPAAQAFAELTGGELVTGAAANALWFDARVLTMPLVSHDDNAFQQLQQNATDALANMPDLGQFTALVRQQIIEHLPLGTASQTCIAQKLAMSERTLLRKLRQSGVGFRDLVGDVRMDLARMYLLDSHLTLSEIALLLGYAEQAPFNRAFKKATDKTPGQWRTEFMTT